MGNFFKKLLKAAQSIAGAADTAGLLAKLGIGRKPELPPKNTTFLGYLVSHRGGRDARGKQRMEVTKDASKAFRPNTRRGPRTGDPIPVFRQYWPDAGRKSRRHAA